MMNDEHLLWWTNVYMPATTGTQFFGNDIKNYKMPTDTIKYQIDATTFEIGVAVTATTEAFLLLSFDNCNQKVDLYVELQEGTWY